MSAETTTGGMTAGSKAGARCIGPHLNGRMYVTLFDAGMIGEVIPQ